MSSIKAVKEEIEFLEKSNVILGARLDKYEIMVNVLKSFLNKNDLIKAMTEIAEKIKEDR